jgi:hypothetical protein
MMMMMIVMMMMMTKRLDAPDDPQSQRRHYRFSNPYKTHLDPPQRSGINRREKKKARKCLFLTIVYMTYFC